MDALDRTGVICSCSWAIASEINDNMRARYSGVGWQGGQGHKAGRGPGESKHPGRAGVTRRQDKGSLFTLQVPA